MENKKIGDLTQNFEVKVNGRIDVGEKLYKLLTDEKSFNIVHLLSFHNTCRFIGLHTVKCLSKA